MKIAFIGQETTPEKLAAKLAKFGHEIFIYTKNKDESENIKNQKGITVINFHSTLFSPFSVLHALFSSYDIIHLDNSVSNFKNFILKFLKLKTAILKGNLPFGISTRPLKSCDYLSEWNLRKGEYILSVSRLIRHKGIHYLIDAFKNLEDKHLTRGKKLVIVGDGFHTQNYVNEIKDIARGRDNIIFTGAQTGEALRQLFSHAYLFVQPSESEGLSLALLEAMGYGKGILSSDIPENKKALREDNGIFFRSKDASDLEKKLVSLINDPLFVKRIGERAMASAQKYYSWDQISVKIESLYEEVLAKKRKRFLIFKRKYEKSI